MNRVVNKLNIAISVILSGLLAVLPGCATVLQPGPDMITVSTNPQGANIYLDEMIMGKSPSTIPVDRSCDAVFRIEKDGYIPIIIDRDKRLAGWFFPGNLLWFSAFPIAMIVDLASSNQGKYSTAPININLIERPGAYSGEISPPFRSKVATHSAAITTSQFKVLNFFFNYDTNQGEIKVETYGRGIECRDWLVKNIGDICSSKIFNESKKGGRHRILSEKIENDILTVQFESTW